MFDGKEYIYAVYEEKSFSKAAQKLYICLLYTSDAADEL